MADDQSTTETAEAPAMETPAPASAPTETSSEVPREVTAALRKANKEAETLRLRLKEFEDRDKTDLQKLSERAEAAERRSVELEQQSLRRQVALDNGLPAALVDRLRGDSLEALTEDAQSLLALVKAKAPADVDQGLRGKPGDGQWTDADMSGKTPAQIMAAKDAGLLDNLLNPPR